MPEPIADDLRCRVLAAWEAGDVSLRELAIRFRVGKAWVKKIRQQQRRTGQAERVAQTRRGFPSRVDEAARERLRAWVEQQPDRTARELCALLRQELNIAVCVSRVGQVTLELGLRRKKNSARVRA